MFEVMTKNLNKDAIVKIYDITTSKSCRVKFDRFKKIFDKIILEEVGDDSEISKTTPS